MEIKGVTKDYKNNRGVFDVNIKLSHGEVYGLIGPNGAGKTTLIRTILGFIKPDSGEIIVEGMQTWNNSKNIMEEIGYLSSDPVLFENMTGEKYINFVKKTKDIIDEKFIENLITYFDIDLKTKIKKLSKGNKQKIAILCTLMHNPKYIILDEPTTGLDPLMQEKFNNLIKKLSEDKNRTILFSSHIFSEISSVCTKVGFLKQGVLKEELNVKNISYDQIHNKFKELFAGEIDNIFDNTNKK